MEIPVWIAFLVGAPLLLWWLWTGNRKRRERWREWCRTRGWRIEIDRDHHVDAGTQRAWPRFPIDAEHLRRESLDLLCSGVHDGREAASWEWRSVSRPLGAGSRHKTGTNTLHAVALRLPLPVPTRVALLPTTMLLLSMTGFLDIADIETGLGNRIEGWRSHADDEAAARAWLRTHLPSLGKPVAADLALLQFDGDVVVAWFLGETRLERIEPTLAWLSGIVASATR